MNAPVITKRLKTSVPMAAKDLQVGMFVSHLDCGWQNTPFLLEGVLLSAQHELATIRALATNVTVDPTRSQLTAFPPAMEESLYEIDTGVVRTATAPVHAPGYVQEVAPPASRGWRGLVLSLAAIFSAGPTAANDLPAGTKEPLGSNSSVSRASTNGDADHAKAAAEPFPRFVATVYAAPERHHGPFWLQRLSLWWRGIDLSLGTRTVRARPIRGKARPDFIPENFDLVRYPAPEPTVASIPMALKACKLSEQALIRIATDIKDGGTIDLHSLEEAADTLAENMIRRPATMMLAARMRDENDRIYQHGLGVAIYLTMLGRHLGFQREPLAELASIGLLLDLGKVTLDQSLLDKPGQYDDTERKIMRTHVEIGVDRLAASGVNSELTLRAVAEHHERVDGRGYPNGLAGDDLSIYGKMAAIADSFVAMVGDRPYAPTMSTYEALRALFAEAGTRWHAPLVEQFVQSIGVFPVGSLIELATGEVAIVVQDNQFRRLEPKILILTNKDKKQLKEPRSMDMMKHNFAIAPASVRILRGLADGAYGVNFREFYIRHRDR